MIKYKVRLFQDERYEVYTVNTDSYWKEHESGLFIGSLADCEAWIRLTERGYM